MRQLSLLVVVVVVLVAVVEVQGHGRLWEPASRASAFRLGFDTPPNYNDNQLFCGGFTHQWYRNQGKCGICGDPYDGIKHHEAGGKYATGRILTSYMQGEVIRAHVEITANHKGYIEFRICAHNDVTTSATQECLDENVLQLADGSGTRFNIDADMREVFVDLKLPEELTCSQCVFQWKYNTGNSWGVDFETSIGCMGCGAQEQFYGCADVAIDPRTDFVHTPLPVTKSPAARAEADDNKAPSER